ncbi:MAG TPA: adenylate/guanylate cyclase domain-containing protein [Acidimicrobiia bacterium]|nr:adenylate/guanylate cyclase domain-containing protein [Acidimicrobiia bacterium]
MFTDIEGSSTRWDEGGAAMESAVSLHDQIAVGAITERGGHVVKKMGDGIMAAFADPSAAVGAAVAIQEAFDEVDWDPSVGTIRVRMGIHTGPGDAKDGDYLGPSVNRAARIEAAGHGGQILLSSATRELIGDRLAPIAFEDLGQHHLRGLSRPERIYQVTRGGMGFPPLRTESTPTNLPGQVKSFVGRSAEIEDLSETIAVHRMVTVTGPGGAGKTTLAIESARRMIDAHPAGVWLFELAPISDGRLIPAEMLGVMRRPAPADADLIEAVTSSLASQQALLIFDNCEHLIDDVAAIVAEVLRAAPGVKVLATSRERLDIAGERVWRIPTMSLPATPERSAVEASDAGRLFLDRAAAADDGFQLTDDDAPAVAEICRRLDGLPLAIELAAARVRTMSPAEIDRRLENRFQLLRGGSRGGLAHHQTLRESVAWSHDLLGPEIRELYRRLSVFAGGFDLAAAEAVVGSGVDVLDGLDQLVSQSLLTVERGDPTRYAMLETIREYGAERLRAEGEEQDTRRAHLEWILALVREGGRELEGRNQVAWLRRFRTEIDNIRSALGWAREHDPVAGATIVAAISRFYWMYATESDSTAMSDSTSYLREGYEWGTTMLDAAGEDLPAKLRARLQLAIGGLLCSRIGRFDEALERLDEAARIFQAEGDTRNLGWATFYRALGSVGVDSSPIEALEIFEQSVALHSEAEDRFGVLMGNLMLGFCEMGRDIEVAAERLTWAREATLATKVPAMIAHGADGVAQLDATRGTVTDETRRNAAEALATFRKVKNYACICHALHGASSVLAAEGRIEPAARAYGVTDAIRKRLSMVTAPYENRDWMIADIAGEDFEGEVWNRARAEGATFEPDEGIDWVITQLGVDPAELG